MSEKKAIKKFKIAYISTLAFLVFVFGMLFLKITEMSDRYVYPFININGLYQNIMQRDYVYDVDPENDIIKTSKGQLVSISKRTSEDKVMESVNGLRESSDWCRQIGIPLIYIQAPSKLSFEPDGAMTGIANNTFEKVEFFLKSADKAGIEYIDAREWFDEDYNKDFFATDHHWTLGKSLDVASRIGRYLNSDHNFGINNEFLDTENYQIDVHKNVFLGTEGRRTGRYYVGLDDIEYITPLFNTDFNIQIEDKEGNKSERKGDFENSVIDRSKDIDRYSFEDSAYYLYWGGDYGRIHIDNNKVETNKSILIFKDSYGAPVSAFLIPYFNSVDIIDLRYYKGEKSVKEIISEEDPDAVLFIYGPGYLAKKKMFTIK